MVDIVGQSSAWEGEWRLKEGKNQELQRYGKRKESYPESAFSTFVEFLWIHSDGRKLFVWVAKEARNKWNRLTEQEKKAFADIAADNCRDAMSDFIYRVLEENTCSNHPLPATEAKRAKKHVYAKLKSPTDMFSILMDDFKKKSKGKSAALLAEEVANKWKRMTSEEKKPYMDKYDKLREEYNKQTFAFDEEELIGDANVSELYARWRWYYDVFRCGQELKDHLKFFQETCHEIYEENKKRNGTGRRRTLNGLADKTFSEVVGRKLLCDKEHWDRIDRERQWKGL